MRQTRLTLESAIFRFSFVFNTREQELSTFVKCTTLMKSGVSLSQDVLDIPLSFVRNRTCVNPVDCPLAERHFTLIMRWHNFHEVEVSAHGNIFPEIKEKHGKFQFPSQNYLSNWNTGNGKSTPHIHSLCKPWIETDEDKEGFSAPKQTANANFLTRPRKAEQWLCKANKIFRWAVGHRLVCKLLASTASAS